MRREEFCKEIESLKEKTGMWKIAIDELNMSDFTLGCYFDNSNGLWKVYINNERGRHRIRLETKSEEEALSKLYDMVSVKAETHIFFENRKK